MFVCSFNITGISIDVCVLLSRETQPPKVHAWFFQDHCKKMLFYS